MAVDVKLSRTITPGMIEGYAAAFRSDPGRRTWMNAIRKNGVNAVAMNQDAAIAMPYTFSHEIRTGDITNQKSSGRCWLFAGLNALRAAVARNLGVESFEMSQAYMMFWDKFEKANYFLESILETRGEPADGRLVAWLLADPVQDGGQWDMFVNLVGKYGIVPKYTMPETFHSSQSSVMNRLLTGKLRENAARLRELHLSQGATTAMLQQQKDVMLGGMYTLLCDFLGEPPVRFDFEYRDRENGFHRAQGLTPQDFLREYVKTDLSEYVSVINAPTADKPFDRTYTVRYLGNVKGGRDVLYLNVAIEELKRVALAQLMDGEPVWFGCDVGKMSDRDSGVMDATLFDYEGALGVPFRMTKAQRLDFGESQMTHAMVFTGVNVVDGRPNRWKVENSWGKEPGKDGFYVMSDTWFDEFMYQVVVRKSYLPPHLQEALKQPPVELAPWDPMGSLA